MAYQVTDEMKQKWRENAKTNQKEARELILSVGKNYTRSPEMIAELLEFGSKFYNYSINNIELIYAQNPRATYFQSYTAWQKMDANVLKGQKGMKIWVPVISTCIQLEDGKVIPLSEATKDQKQQYENGLLRGSKSLHYKIGTVFDVAQTNYDKEKLPSLYNTGDKSELHSLIIDGLIQFCNDNGVDVESVNLKSIRLQGQYIHDDKKIQINSVLQDTNYLSTLTHEIGHMLEEHANRDISRVQKEFEADAISVLIQSMFGIELTTLRKEHLANHYKLFIEEIKDKNPDISEKEQIQKVNEVLDSSIEVFKKNAENMRSKVDEQIKDSKRNKSENKTPDSIDDIVMTFTVAECSEFHDVGIYVDDFISIKNALKYFEEIKEKSAINGVPGLGIKLHKVGSEPEEDIQWDFLVGKNLDIDALSFLPEMKNYAPVKEVLKYLERYNSNQEQKNEQPKIEMSMPIRKHRTR